MNFDDAVAALDARSNYERTGRLTSPSLDRMHDLMDLMAHPEASFPAIQVTGTNGKTTCARAATEVLRAAGLGVATYVSPHVESIRERFLFDGAPIDSDDFVEAWRELAPFLDVVDGKHEQPVTWFEAATALAFTYFADRAVDVAVVEVGMGGSWDATNVVDGQVAAITRVAIDHPELGATPAEIAREKAGIIKPGAIACLAEQDAEVAAIFRARCDEMQAEMRAEGIAFAVESGAVAVGGRALAVRLGKDRYDGLFLPMHGAQFAHDAVLGAAAARAFLGDRHLSAGILGDALSNLAVEGRMEVMRRRPLVVLDGAHNPAAARALAHELPSSFSFERCRIVFSAMRDKDVRGMIEALAPVATEFVMTRNDSPRAAAPEDLVAMAAEFGKNASIVANVDDAVSVAIERSEDTDCVCVTGSLYTVGEARRKLAQPRRIDGN